MRALTHRWGKVSAVIDNGQAVATAKFCGELEAGHARQAVADYAALLQSSKAPAAVIDYTDARCAFSIGALGRQVRQVARSQRVLAKPAAFIVRHDELADWQGYAQRLAGAGILRAAFADPWQAGAWAAEMAALYAAQARFRVRE